MNIAQKVFGVKLMIQAIFEKPKFRNEPKGAYSEKYRSEYCYSVPNSRGK